MHTKKMRCPQTAEQDIVTAFGLIRAIKGVVYLLHTALFGSRSINRIIDHPAVGSELFGSLSYHKQTAPEVVCDRTETTLSFWSAPEIAVNILESDSVSPNHVRVKTSYIL